MSVLSLGAASLLIPAIAMRELGATGYGLYALVAAATSLIVPLDVGLSLGVSRSAAREATSVAGPLRTLERQRIIASQSLYAGAAILALAVTAIACVAISVGGLGSTGADPAEMAALVGLLGVNVAVVLGTSASSGILVGMRRFRTTGGAAALGSMVTCVALPWSIRALAVPGIGVAVLLGTLVSRCFVVARARQFAPWMEFRLPSLHDSRLREVGGLAVPMVVLGIGSQIVATTDVFVISLMGSSASVGLYRAASLVPSQIITLIFRGYDASFPALAQEQDQTRQEAATRVLTRLASISAGVALGGVAWLSADLIEALTGQGSALGSNVLRIFAAIWCVNAAAHGLALVLIVRSQHRVFTPLVIGESVMNLLASLLLVRLIGPIGAAWATLITIAVSNLVLLPLLTRKQFVGSTLSLVLTNGLLFAGLGAAVAGAVVWLASAPGLEGTSRLGAAGVGLLFSGVAFAAWAIGRDGRTLVAGAFQSRSARVPPLATSDARP